MHILAITPGRGFEPRTWAPVLRSGVDGFLLREPGLEARDLLSAARWCREAAPEVALWVGGRLDVALACGAGLHAPERHPELPGGLVPLSRPLHAPAQLDSRRACAQLLVAPVFPSPGKGEPWGLRGLHALLDAMAEGGPRVLALGGVDAANAPSMRHPRLDGVALIRALWEAPEPAGAVEALRKAWA